jgi:hypothetical protein
MPWKGEERQQAKFHRPCAHQSPSGPLLFAIPFGTAPEAVRNGSQKSQSKLSSHRTAIAGFGSFEDGSANSLTSPASRRVYKYAIEKFVAWYCSEPRIAFNRILVVRYRIHLESCCLAANTINQHLAAVRRLAHEAADAGLLSPDLAAGIARVKGVKQLGQRSGKWLTQDQSAALNVHPAYRKPFNLIFQRAKKDEWSALADDFRTFLGSPHSHGSI